MLSVKTVLLTAFKTKKRMERKLKKQEWQEAEYNCSNAIRQFFI